MEGNGHIHTETVSQSKSGYAADFVKYSKHWPSHWLSHANLCELASQWKPAPVAAPRTAVISRINAGRA